MAPSQKCFACTGPYHEATGHNWEKDGYPNVVYCGPCYRNFVRWMKGHLNRKWSGHQFYDEAATSIRPGIYPSENRFFPFGFEVL